MNGKRRRENGVLKRELAKVTEERDILKKPWRTESPFAGCTLATRAGDDTFARVAMIAAKARER